MTEWQPIETAPIKTDILISAKYIPLEWEKDNDKYKNTIYDYFIASRAYKDSPYWDACGSSLICHDGGEGEHCVTHWMPLPPAPVDKINTSSERIYKTGES